MIMYIFFLKKAPENTAYNLSLVLNQPWDKG